MTNAATRANDLNSAPRRTKFRAQEPKFRCPDADQALPPAPAGLATHRPCLWLAAPCVVSTPKRERDLSPDVSDVTSDMPNPERRLSETQYGRQYGNAPATRLGLLYSFDIINRGSLRGYPPSSVLYGVKTDATLLTGPAFTALREAERDTSRPFNRGEQDPATFARGAVGASRVLAEEIEMRAWNEGVQRIEITRPSRGRPELFRAYEPLPRRVADGAANHSWPYGTRLGPRASGQRSNMAEGSKQPPTPPALRKTNCRGLLQIL